MPKISVVMSVYKEPVEWIRQSIDSILNQTYKDFEFIIVNDNPERKENVQILNEYILKDSRISIITNNQNIGLTKSLNKGLEVAKGEYVARMDADDISLPERFEKQVRYMDSNPDIMALGAQAYIIDEDGKKRGVWHVYEDVKSIKSAMLFQSPMLHPLAMFHRIINGKEIRYDETMKYAQDYALWTYLIKDHIVGNLSDYLLYYRVSTQQISSKNFEGQARCAVRVQENIFEICEYIADTDVKTTIEVVTRNYKTNINCNYLYNNIVRFVNDNKYNSNYSADIIHPKLFIAVCNYLPRHYNFKDSLQISLKLSSVIRVFQFYPFLSMIYKLFKNNEYTTYHE